MANGGDVLFMLCPNAEWVSYGDNYEDINWFAKEPAVTKKQFEDGFTKWDAWKAEQDKIKAEQKQTILDRIGLTAEELKTILG